MQFNNENATGILEFVSVPNHKIYSEFSVPGIDNKWICGSFTGWVVTSEIKGQQINLLNPFTNVQIPLPSISTFQHPRGSFRMEFDDFGFVRKVVVLSLSSKNKLDNDCVFTGIISCHAVLSICRPGDDRWTNIEGSPIRLSDVLPYKGKIYALNGNGSVVTCDVANDSKITIIAGRTPETGIDSDVRYLVESSDGDLLQVVRGIDDEKFTTSEFAVYRLVEVEEPQTEAVDIFSCYMTINKEHFYQEEVRYKWVELKSLGDQMLFLGCNSSMALSVSLYPGCKGNCIYFTHGDEENHIIATREIRDGNERGHKLPKHDMGMYDMESEKVFPYEGMYNAHFPLPPVWVVPNPWQRSECSSSIFASSK